MAQERTGLSVGDAAPPFALQASDGREIRLDGYPPRPGSYTGVHTGHLVTQLPNAAGAVANPSPDISCAWGRGPGYCRAARRKGGRILPRSWFYLPDPRRSRSFGDQALRSLSSARTDGVQHRAAGHVYHRSCATYLLHVYQQRSVGSSGS